MVTVLKRIVKQSRTMIIAYKIYDNWQVKRRFQSGNIESQNGATHRAFSLERSLDYINVQFADYLRYGELTPEALGGQRVFELGFGDNIGVALKFLAVGGVEQVVCLDKYYSTRNAEQHRKIYLALRDGLSEEEKKRFDEAIDLSIGIEVNPEKLHCIYGVSPEESEELANSKPFDLIISRAVIQDIYEPDAALAAMDRVLARGGLMLHKIDLSDLGMFTNSGMNPLTFLTISDSVYRMMAADSAKPNRKLSDYYRHQMAELGYDAKILATEIIGRQRKGDLHPHKERLEFGVDYDDATLALIREIRPRLNPRYRNLPDEDLLVAGIFIVARKPL